MAVGGPARLVVEIKPGGRGVVTALESLRSSSPHLFDAVSVIMSFDIDIARASAAMVDRSFPKGAQRPSVMFLSDTKEYCGQDYCGQSLSLSTLDDAVVERFIAATKRELGCDDKPAAGARGAGVDSSHFEEHPALDGLYIRFEESMLTDGPEAERFKALCARYVVGVWGARSDGKFDTLQTVSRLVSLGATFVNTDLPLTFAPHSPL